MAKTRADGEPSADGTPVIDWLRTDPEPALLGQRCAVCTTTCFPPTAPTCPNPSCANDDLDVVALSRRGRIWSYTDARYQPPPPYVATTDPYQPFAIAAVELAEERLVILGQVADGYGLDDLAVGAPAEVVVEPLETDADGTPRLVWRWKPVVIQEVSR